MLLEVLVHVGGTKRGITVTIPYSWKWKVLNVVSRVQIMRFGGNEGCSFSCVTGWSIFFLHSKKKKKTCSVEVSHRP
jgi:hypothetical protein